jgi:hypothetical protein
MTAAAGSPDQLLALADLIEAWARAIPDWQADTGERWDAFAERRFGAEQDLAARLQGLPTCRLRRHATGRRVDLRLGGIRVCSSRGLARACQAWADAARAEAGLGCGSSQAGRRVP